MTISPKAGWGGGGGGGCLRGVPMVLLLSYLRKWTFFLVVHGKLIYNGNTAYLQVDYEAENPRYVYFLYHRFGIFS